MSETEDREYVWPHAFFVGQVESILEREGITRVELAKRMGKTSAYVSQLLGRPNNMTLNTMVQISDALGHRLHPFMYLPSSDALPRALESIQSVWEGETEVTEENARDILVSSFLERDSILDGNIEDEIVHFSVAVDFDDYDPTVISDLYTCAAYLKRIIKVNFLVKIDYVEAPDD